MELMVKLQFVNADGKGAVKTCQLVYGAVTHITIYTCSIPFQDFLVYRSRFYVLVIF